MALNGKRLGDLLLEADVLTKRQLKKALAMQAAGDARQIGQILIELEFITLDDLTEIMLTNGHDPTPPPAPPIQQRKSSKPIDISEDVVMKTKFALDVKTMIGAATGIASLVGMWYALQADIEEAKELPVPPPPDVTRMEYDMKDQLIRQTIMTTQDDVKELKEDIDRIEAKIDQLK